MIKRLFFFLFALICFTGPKPVQAQTALPDPVPDNVKQVLADSWKNWNAVSDYQFTMRAFCRKGNRFQRSTYNDYFKKPDMFRTDVTAGPKSGSVVIQQADGRIKGHQGGLLAMIVLTLSPKDSRLYDIRGNFFMEAEWSRHLKQIESLLVGGAQSTLNSDTMNEQPVLVLTITISQPIDGLTKEIIWFDAVQKYIVKIQEFAGADLVLENIITNQKNNQNLPDSLFTL